MLFPKGSAKIAHMSKPELTLPHDGAIHGILFSAPDGDVVAHAWLSVAGTAWYYGGGNLKKLTRDEFTIKVAR